MVRSPGTKSILRDESCGWSPPEGSVAAAGAGAAAEFVAGAETGCGVEFPPPAGGGAVVGAAFGDRLASSGPPRDFTDRPNCEPGANSIFGPSAATSIRISEAAAPTPAPIAAPLTP